MRLRGTRLWAAWLSSLALALALLLAAREADAVAIRWRVDPSESGDPDEPGSGIMSPKITLDVFLASLRARLGIPAQGVSRATSSVSRSGETTDSAQRRSTR